MLHITRNIIIILLLSLNNSFGQGNQYKNLIKADYLLLIDQDTRDILLEKNADEIIAPSSMTKLMTSYVIFRELKEGRINLNNQCLIGKDAWRKKGSTMFLNYGDVVSIDELLRGLIITSGNDSSIALAQSVSGSVKSFAKLMNKVAKDIGLENSNFKNPHGLNEHGHYMTLRDLATLTNRIHRDFPEFTYYFSIKEFTYDGITQRNRNPLIRNKYEGATGMKTGYTSDGGYGVVGTASRNGRNLIAVTNNAPSAKQRGKIIIELLDFGFDNFDKITLFPKNTIIVKADVWLGEQDTVDLIAKDDVAINIPKNQVIEDLDFEIEYSKPIFTPIKKNQKLGKLIIKAADESIKEIPLYAKQDVKKANYFSRMWYVFRYKLTNFLD